ncbi:NepR family anti-sigma factor [Novosphingobium mangrovi (ex Huang et al. 2023)]|uniref:NepR family anti-sigma factor n=1 Tax=Novosphingobium mangrovi (ex Huang et al. 2023) TaxID=2976432 RepID=UPI0028830CA4|nr:NepR family anti-sigma factor [Novosphingobium mangrovi (ex Huang et al. 2023)]
MNQPSGRKNCGKVHELLPDVRKPREDGEPGWASGLRKLYNSVIEEPLPDSFQDLLKKLDDSDDD